MSAAWFPTSIQFRFALRSIRCHYKTVTIYGDFEGQRFVFRDAANNRWLGTIDREGEVTTQTRRGLSGKRTEELYA